MKNTQILVIFIIGMVLVLFGAWLKLDRHPDASLPLIIGLTFEGAAILLIILKITRKDKNDRGFFEN